MVLFAFNWVLLFGWYSRFDAANKASVIKCVFLHLLQLNQWQFKLFYDSFSCMRIRLSQLCFFVFIEFFFYRVPTLLVVQRLSATIDWLVISVAKCNDQMSVDHESMIDDQSFKENYKKIIQSMIDDQSFKENYKK